MYNNKFKKINLEIEIIWITYLSILFLLFFFFIQFENFPILFLENKETDRFLKNMYNTVDRSNTSNCKKENIDRRVACAASKRNILFCY